jgi:hypothetical protein
LTDFGFPDEHRVRAELEQFGLLFAVEFEKLEQELQLVLGSSTGTARRSAGSTRGWNNVWVWTAAQDRDRRDELA